MEEYGYVSGNTPGFWDRLSPYLKTKTFTFVILAVLAVATPLTAFYLQNNTFDTRQRASGGFQACADSNGDAHNASNQITAHCTQYIKQCYDTSTGANIDASCSQCDATFNPYWWGACDDGSGNGSGGGNNYEGRSCGASAGVAGGTCHNSGYSGTYCNAGDSDCGGLGSGYYCYTSNSYCSPPTGSIPRYSPCNVSGQTGICDSQYGYSNGATCTNLGQGDCLSGYVCCSYPSTGGANGGYEGRSCGASAGVVGGTCHNSGYSGTYCNAGDSDCGGSGYYCWAPSGARCDGATGGGGTVPRYGNCTVNGTAGVCEYSYNAVPDFGYTACDSMGQGNCIAGFACCRRPAPPAAAPPQTTIPRPQQTTIPTTSVCQGPVSCGLNPSISYYIQDNRYYKQKSSDVQCSQLIGDLSALSIYCAPTTPTTSASGPTANLKPASTHPTATSIPVTGVPIEGSTGGNVTANLELVLQGIGLPTNLIDDEAAPNTAPPQAAQTKQVALDISVAQSITHVIKTGTVTYDASTKKFKGSIDLGTIYDNFTVQIRIPGYAKQLVGQRTNAVIIQPTATVTVREALLGADINNDGSITGADYEAANSQSTLRACFGKSPTGACQYADINADGVINLVDYKFLIDNIIKRK